MKGLKWKLSEKFVVLLTSLFAIFAISLANINNVSALSITNSFNQYYYSTTTLIGNPNPASNYQWSAKKYMPNAEGICGDTCYITGISRIKQLQVSYQNITTEGNHAALHFELNLRSQNNRGADSSVYAFNDNLPNLQLDSVAFYPNNGSGVVLTKESSNLSYVITEFNDGGYANQTVTIYVDVTLSGIPSNTTGALRVNLTTRNVQISAASSDFFLAFLHSSHTITWVEQNPTSIVYTNNLNDALLSQQIAQNEVMIENQSRIINAQNATTDAVNNLNDTINQQNQQNQQDRQELENTSSSAENASDDSSQAVTDASSSLLVIMGNFIDIILHPPSSDCSIDADMGHMDLGQIDLCQLPVPPAVGTIATVLLIALLIPFVISLVNTFLSLLKGATQ